MSSNSVLLTGFLYAAALAHMFSTITDSSGDNGLPCLLPSLTGNHSRDSSLRDVDLAREWWRTNVCMLYLSINVAFASEK